MKVLVVSPLVAPPSAPVQSVVLDREAAELVRLGHEVRLVLPAPRAPWPLRLAPRWRVYERLPSEEVRSGFAVAHPRHLHLPARIAPGLVEPLRSFPFAAALAPEVERFAAAGGRVAHVHTALVAGRAVLRLRARRPELRLVLSLHDHELQKSAPSNPRLARAVREAIRGADHVVYISEKLRRLGHALAGEHPSSVVYPGVEIPAEVAPRPPGLVVITVARLVPTKGIDVLLGAFARLARVHPEARLVVVGDGPEAPALRGQAARLGIFARVDFRGALPHGEVLRALEGAHVFALPSFVEALGIAYLEAMAQGLPVIGICGEGIADLVRDGENGLLVPPRDEDALFRALMSLAQDPALRVRLGAAGRATVVARDLSWPRHARELLRILEQVASLSLPNRPA